MNKFIRLLLSFLSVLLFYSCSNNLKSSSLVISFNLPNQKNQNVQRTATNQENINVTVTLYDVLTTENNLQNLADFKIIETQTVPIVNNKALVQIDDIRIGTNALITAQITQNNQTLYEGKSEFFTVFEGENQVKIQLKKVSSSVNVQIPNSDLLFGKIDADNNTEGLLINSEAGLNYFRNIVNGTLTENIIVSDNVVYRSGTAYPTVNAKLCNDITLTEDYWVPIGNSTNYYQGTFDGNGKCVTNLNITTDRVTDLGFFGCVQDATIKNLYVQGIISATNDSSQYAVGGIVGYAKSSEGKSVTISNCINNVQIDYQSTYVGGILGNLSNQSEIKIESCVNIAELTAQYPSGILNTYGNSTINNCLNLGNLTSTSTAYNRTAGICMTYNVNCSVSNCINTGIINNSMNDTVSPILMWENTVSGSSPNCTNCFYDSDKIQNVAQGTPGTGKITSWFYTEDTNSEEKLSNWSFNSGRYPLPSTLQSIFDDENSSDDVWAKLCKAAETGITTWSALASAIEDEISTQSEFVITNNLVATETIEIRRPITISGSGITITRGYSNGGDVFQNTFFNVYEGSLQIVCNNENKKIVFDGANLEATSPFISADTDLSITNCVFKQNKISTIVNEEYPNGSINVTNGSFNLKNCDFSNNVTTGLGGAISINRTTNKSITSFIENCCFENNITQNSGGGAIYIYGTTVQDTEETHTLKDCIFSNNAINTNSSNNGGAIYLLRGTLILDGVTMNKNRFYSDENTYVDSDIFVYRDNTFIKLKNKNSIECFIDNFGSNSTPKITLDEPFSTESKINFLCVPMIGASVDVGDVLLQNNNLSNEQIMCFTIKDSDGRNYSLGSDGKLINNSN